MIDRVENLEKQGGIRVDESEFSQAYTQANIFGEKCDAAAADMISILKQLAEMNQTEAIDQMIEPSIQSISKAFADISSLMANVKAALDKSIADSQEVASKVGNASVIEKAKKVGGSVR